MSASKWTDRLLTMESFDCNRFMFLIRPLPEFTAWIDGLKNETVRGVARIKQLERGLMGDIQPVADNVSELRIHVGPGWRFIDCSPG